MTAPTIDTAARDLEAATEVREANHINTLAKLLAIRAADDPFKMQAYDLARGYLALTEKVAELEAQVVAWKADAERLAEIGAKARYMIDTGAMLIGDTLEYSHETIAAVIGLLDPALSTHDAMMKENGNG